MRTVLSVSLTVTCFIFTGMSSGSPMIPYGPMTIEGTIQEISWFPEKFIKGEPGMSGSLGFDRTLPATYSITLIDTVVDKSKMADDPFRLSYESGKPIKISIKHKEDDGFLKKGMRIRVTDYEVNGDEGGTWSSYEKVEIIEKGQILE